jgi:hypothetical protein
LPWILALRPARLRPWTPRGWKHPCPSRRHEDDTGSAWDTLVLGCHTPLRHWPDGGSHAQAWCIPCSVQSVNNACSKHIHYVYHTPALANSSFCLCVEIIRSTSVASPAVATARSFRISACCSTTCRRSRSTMAAHIIEAPWVSTPATVAGRWRARRLNNVSCWLAPAAAAAPPASCPPAPTTGAPAAPRASPDHLRRAPSLEASPALPSRHPPSLRPNPGTQAIRALQPHSTQQTCTHSFHYLYDRSGQSERIERKVSRTACAVVGHARVEARHAQILRASVGPAPWSASFFHRK